MPMSGIALSCRSAANPDPLDSRLPVFPAVRPCAGPV